MSSFAIIAIIALLAPFVLTIIVTLARLHARTQQERLRCEVIRTAIERGQPIPAGVFGPPSADAEASETKETTAHRDVRNGIVAIGLGIGLFVFLQFFSFWVSGLQTSFKLRGWQWIGAVPICVGVALILSSRLARKTESTTRPAVAPGSRENTGT